MLPTKGGGVGGFLGLMLVSALLMPALLGTVPPATAGTQQQTTLYGYLGYFYPNPGQTIVKGGTIRVAAKFESGGVAVQGATVQLWVKPFDSPWEQAEGVVSDATGVATVKTPARRTVYQWRFTESGQYAESQSIELICRVRVKVTMKIADRTLRRGQRVVITGLTKPAKPGTVARLRHSGIGGDFTVAKTTIRADGSYKFSKRLPAGRSQWALYVKVPGAAGNLSGTSPLKSVVVS